MLALLIDPAGRGDAVARRVQGCHLAAPDLLPYQVVDVLRRRRNTRLLSAADARLAVDGFLTLPIELWPFLVVAERCWSLGENLTAYHAAYVALAEHLGASLLTGDRRLAAAPGPTAVIETF